MYEKPRVERFGTFRELTQAGFTGQCDGYTVSSNTTGNSTDGSDLLGTTGPCTSRS